MTIVLNGNINNYEGSHGALQCHMVGYIHTFELEAKSLQHDDGLIKENKGW